MSFTIEQWNKLTVDEWFDLTQSAKTRVDKREQNATGNSSFSGLCFLCEDLIRKEIWRTILIVEGQSCIAHTKCADGFMAQEYEKGVVNAPA